MLVRFCLSSIVSAVGKHVWEDGCVLKPVLPHRCSLSCKSHPGITPSYSPVSSDCKKTTKGILDELPMESGPVAQGSTRGQVSLYPSMTVIILYRQEHPRLGHWEMLKRFILPSG